MKKLLLTGIIMVVATASFFINSYIKQADHDGRVTIVLVDQIDDILLNETLYFDQGDTLFELLDEQYDIACGDNQYKPSTCETTPFYGRVIVTFEEVETDWLNTYIAIYINDEYSTYGIDDITLEDGAIYRFEYTEVGDIE